MQGKRVLVVFGGSVPAGKVVDLVIAPCALELEVRRINAPFEALEEWTDPGSIEEAGVLLRELAQATLPDGTRVAKTAVYEGYESWWFSYDELFYQECVPYTQYKRLLEHLRGYAHVEVCRPPATALFSAYFEAYNVAYVLHGEPRNIPSLGVWLQVALSLCSLPLLMIKRPGVLLYTGDRLDFPRDHDFRVRFVYDELRARNVSFVESVRSLEPVGTLLRNALKRGRPVIYSYAIRVVCAWIAGLSKPQKTVMRNVDSRQHFLCSLATLYHARARGIVSAVRVTRIIIRMVGIRAAFIPAASSRTYHEVLACRLEGIPTVGILHGASSRRYNVYDFVPEYDSPMPLGLDIYGVWSVGWKEYYVTHSHVYDAQRLVVSGPVRPLAIEPQRSRESQAKDSVVKVLFVAGELSVPAEVLPYLEALLADERISVYLTFRPYKDAFEAWVRNHEPHLLERIGIANIFKGRHIEKDIEACDVVVGSYSTAVLESLLQTKPPVFFMTRKWGDYFDMGSVEPSFFANTPKELVQRVLQARHTSSGTLKALRERFFGDSHKNGSVWVVDRLQDLLNR